MNLSPMPLSRQAVTPVYPGKLVLEPGDKRLRLPPGSRLSYLWARTSPGSSLNSRAWALLLCARRHAAPT